MTATCTEHFSVEWANRIHPSYMSPGGTLTGEHHLQNYHISIDGRIAILTKPHITLGRRVKSMERSRTVHDSGAQQLRSQDINGSWLVENRQQF